MAGDAIAVPKCKPNKERMVVQMLEDIERVK